MKRMVIALILLVIIVCTAFVTSSVAGIAIDETCKALKECDLKSKNEKSAFIIDQTVSKWNRNKVILYVIMSHEDFFKIEENMAKLEYMSRHNDFSSSSRICTETEMLLRNKKEETKINFENIF